MQTLAEMAEAHRSKKGYGSTDFRWTGVRCFGGLHIDLTRPDFYTESFAIDLLEGRGFDARKVWQNQLDLLISRFGQPHRQATIAYFGPNYPIAQWQWGRICLQHAVVERFVDFISTGVSRETTGL